MEIKKHKKQIIAGISPLRITINPAGYDNGRYGQYQGLGEMDVAVGDNDFGTATAVVKNNYLTLTLELLVARGPCWNTYHNGGCDVEWVGDDGRNHKARIRSYDVKYNTPHWSEKDHKVTIPDKEWGTRKPLYLGR